MFLGEWLNGRVAVSKTVGCVFESRLPCQKNQTEFRFGFFVWSAIRTKTASEREHYIIDFKNLAFVLFKVSHY